MLRLKRNFWIKLGISFALLVSLGCATVPDVDSCVEISEIRGYCFKTISPIEFPVDQDHLYNGKDWPTLRKTSIIVPSNSWAELKSYLLKQCHKSKECRDKIGDWFATLEQRFL